MSPLSSVSLAIVVLIMSGSAALAQDATPETRSTFQATAVASSPDQILRGLRYCEILVPGMNGSSSGVELRVYTTQGLNDCPLELWDAIDARTEARQLGVPMVLKNGPRFVAYDQISAEIDGDIESFQGLDMQLVATLELPEGSMPQERPSYVGMTVARNTEYVYLAGKPVFELFAPDGSVYVMQTYVTVGDLNGDFAGLNRLVDRLTLPEGWTFRQVVPDQDLHAATSDGKATVIRDDLGNTYQLLTSEGGTPVPAN